MIGPFICVCIVAVWLILFVHPRLVIELATWAITWAETTLYARSLRASHRRELRAKVKQVPMASMTLESVEVQTNEVSYRRGYAHLLLLLVLGVMGMVLIQAAIAR